MLLIHHDNDVETVKSHSPQFSQHEAQFCDKIEHFIVHEYGTGICKV